eukprot:Clim_evm21s3 gene=Clim_evmTU21s3
MGRGGADVISKSASKAVIRDRLFASLLSMFIADALAMPVHWYYVTHRIQEKFGLVKTYMTPENPHEESMVDGMRYTGSLDILHDKRQYYNIGNISGAPGAVHTDSHGNHLMKKENERTHYHNGLHSGEPTLCMQIQRVFLRSVAKRGGYDAQGYLEDFKDFMTTPGAHNDTYTEVFIRRFFEYASDGRPLKECAENQTKVWSIGSHTGVNFAIPAFYYSLFKEQGCPPVAQEQLNEAMDFGQQHHELTHKSLNVSVAFRAIAPTLAELACAENPDVEAIQKAAARMSLPMVTGKKLMEMYREYQGPGNIPDDLVWKLHTDYREEPFRIADYLDMADNDFIGKEVTSACYTEHGVPAVLYLAEKHRGNYEDAIIANVNAGGDNTGRAGILGAVVGLQYGTAAIPKDWRDGLYDQEDIEKDINGFLDVVMGEA